MTDTQAIKWAELLSEALKLPGSMGNTFNKFYNYSYGNQVWFMMQGIHEPVANYNVWKSLGRYAKGGTAKTVMAPMVYKDEAGESQIRGFKLKRAVFAYSDTTGEDIDLDAVVAPGWDLPLAIESLKVERVAFSKTNGNIQGYAYKNKIAINPMCSKVMETTMHELAHIVLGHTTDTKSSDLERGTMEFQAEACAYLLMNELDQAFNGSESRAYIQSWLDGYNPKDAEIKPVFTAVNKILKAGRDQKK